MPRAPLEQLCKQQGAKVFQKGAARGCDSPIGRGQEIRVQALPRPRHESLPNQHSSPTVRLVARLGNRRPNLIGIDNRVQGHE
jgi:hypothetical protein